ncbi:leucyl-tRNA synthetase [Sporobacter termitidis DSM 10068]|uniref:Leucine--tRNA ligase n=1 Tax=Sporobacter termitidis DSM 10068 TaxID=1123282 RepID=A0A1M5UK16_9FIRM|nr:leucine--tRNA ligase [Sporobacter termitidis]SHH63319.1 leucyl-tRNA synthetase [Sporobacter termitidis DSM 10068]
MKYEFARIEKKWQERWEKEKVFAASDKSGKKKFYGLVEFPYPSGEGLHVGHPRPYTAMDIIARKKRMLGLNVLFPIGFDAFGLPTENYAIKNKIHPAIVTKKNIARFTEQLKMLGYSFDWDRVIDTTDPSYYKWTQWIFLKLFERGLAYKASMPVNWCTSCKCVLANEEVVNGVCERCGAEVVRREKSQWMLKITEYAQRLIDDLDELDFIERVKIQQKNWIGRSTGAEVDFATTAGDKLRVYTTRPDTLFGATYMVISPEHEIIKKWSPLLQNLDEVTAYQEAAARKSDFERTEMAKDKTGVELRGVRAVNPVTGNEIPVFISDYVLATYGTGAIMAVPGHDTRDWEFARKFGLPIVEVVAGGDVEKEAFTDCETGVMVNSGFLNGLSVEDAKVKITEWLSDKGLGRQSVKYKLRDWVFSRQRYWGEPIPIVHCDKCGYVALPESELPLLLPEVENYETTDTGESPLAAMTDWLATTCPKCGGHAVRETDTMPQWAGSSWYFLRYADPHNDKALASREALDYWTPVDWYNGGMEHTTLHLLYSRFWHKFLFDIGVVPTSEPYMKRTSHGMILGEDGQKMSKSRGNVINPNDIVDEFGADTLRLYIMFIGDFEKAAPWSSNAVKGCKRFLDRVWNLSETRLEGGEGYSAAHERVVHRAIKKVSEDIENLKFNTAIATLMALVNDFYEKAPSRGDVKTLLALVSPFAPHIAEELWEIQGFKGMACQAQWPSYDESKTIEAERELAVQIGGKLKGTILVKSDAGDDVVLEAAKADEKIKKLIEGKEIIRTIVVKNKLINLIVK